VTVRPLASSKATLPPGPQGNVRSAHRSFICCRTLRAGVRCTSFEGRSGRSSSSGRTILFTRLCSQRAAHRSLLALPRTPTAIRPGAACARRTTTHGQSRTALLTQDGSPVHPEVRDSRSICNRSCTCGLRISELCILQPRWFTITIHTGSVATLTM
jgi:hypothetical protein